MEKLMDKLEVAYFLLAEIIEKKERNEKLKKKYKDSHWSDFEPNSKEEREYLEYRQYKPTQLKQDIVRIRRLLNDANKEI